jgi:hypothetical protein
VVLVAGPATHPDGPNHLTGALERNAARKNHDDHVQTYPNSGGKPTTTNAAHIA